MMSRTSPREALRARFGLSPDLEDEEPRWHVAGFAKAFAIALLACAAALFITAVLGLVFLGVLVPPWSGW